MMDENAFQKRMADARKRIGAWWNRADMDRPVFVMRTEEGMPALKEFFTDSRERWLDIPKRLAYEELKMERTLYHGETYPGVNADLGPGSLALLLGSRPGFDWDTLWYHPGFSDVETTRIVLDQKAEYMQWKLDYTEAALARAEGRYLVELPDLIENFDTLCSLLGAETLFYALGDCPEEVHRLQEEVLTAWFAAFDALYERLRDENGGMSVGYFNLWGPGRTAKLQCDISVALSSAMFDEFVAPYLARQAQGLDYVLYHLDGPAALRHADTILSIPDIKAVQWQPGAGVPDAIDPTWYAVQKRILDAGKSIMIFIKPGDPDTLLARLEAFVKTVGVRGVMFVVEQSLEHTLADNILHASYHWR